jgi:hypothetical protein
MSATGIEAMVCEDIARRQGLGIEKYGTTLADNPAGRIERLQHAYEEALDLACYLKWEIERTKRAGTLNLGDYVQKKSGSAWAGVIVGTYSTHLTPEGYAVESSAHPGSVQIYPASALRLTETEK